MRLDRTRLNPRHSDGLKKPDSANTCRVCGVLGFVKRDSNVRLGGQVVDLVGLDFCQKCHKSGPIAEVPVVQEKLCLGIVRVHVEVINARSVKVEARRISPWTS
jgi:hypothetical protein